MKRFMALALAFVMVMSLGTPALAAENKETVTDKTESQKATINVKGTYKEYLESETVISVDVAWESMNFTYAASQQGKWNVKTHKYDDVKEGEGWVNDSSVITVKNHSNAEITANLTYEPSVTSVTGKFDDKETATIDLVSAAQDAYMGANWQQAPTGTSTFKVDGSMTANDVGKLGTITVSVAKKEASSGGNDAGGEDSESDYPKVDGVWQISTWEHLTAAAKAGGKAKLLNSVTGTEGLLIEDTTLDLDLNQFTLTVAGSGVMTSNTGTVTVENGTIEATGFYAMKGKGTMTVKNCTVGAPPESGRSFYMHRNGTLVVDNCTVSGSVHASGNSTITVTDSTVGKISPDESGKLIIDTDPTGNTDEDAVITNNGNGTWTVTAKSETTDNDDGYTKVSDVAGLKAAMATANSKIKLTNDIDMTEALVGPETGSFDLNLNGYTLTCTELTQNANTTGTISNGSITAYDQGWYKAVSTKGTLTIDNCTLTGNGFFALYVEGGTVIVTNSTLDGGVYLNNTGDGTNSTLTATQEVTIKTLPIYSTSGIWVEPGCTATFATNPTAYLYADNETVVHDNGNETWTVGPESIWTEVSDFDSLKSAVNAGGKIKLMANIDDQNTLTIDPETDVELNLNGHTLTCNGVRCEDVASVVISNGTVKTNEDYSSVAVFANGGKLTIDKCTITAGKNYALSVNGCTVTVNGGKLEGGVELTGEIKRGNSTLTATDVTIEKLEDGSGGILVEPGSRATFNKNPTSLLSEDNTTAVHANDNFTWTVGPDSAADDDDGYTKVSTSEALQTAMDAGGQIKLTDDIEDSTIFKIKANKKVELDLNGYTLTCDTLICYDGAIVVISNGTIETSKNSNRNAVQVMTGKLTIDNCTITAKNEYALSVDRETVTVNDSKLEGGVYLTGSDGYGYSTLTATNVWIEKLSNGTKGICVKAGCTATFDMDPTLFLDDKNNEAAVHENDNYTWTVGPDAKA